MKKARLLFSVLFLLGGYAGFAQGVVAAPGNDTTDRVEILNNTRELTFQTIDDSTKLTIISGDVKLRQGKTLFYCDSCVINNRTNVFEAWGYKGRQVHINDSDTANIYSNHLRYLMKDKIAYLDGNSKLTDGNATLTTPDLVYDMETNIGTYTNGGKVINKKTILTSKEGYYYADLKDVYFKRNVLLKDPGYTIVTDSLLYNTETQMTRFISQTTITDSSKRIIKTRDGFYNQQTGKAEFGQRPEIVDGDTRITGDRVAIDDSTGMSQVEGNAVIVDTKNKTTVIGGLVFRNKLTETILATRMPLMIVQQNDDSIYISADTLFSGRLSDRFGMDSVIVDTVKGTKIAAFNEKDSANRYFEAYSHVRIYNDSLQASSDSMFYSFRDSVFRLYKDPVVWAQDSQVTGDTIHLFTKNKKADRVEAFENGFMINQVGNDAFNQIKSSRIDGWFLDGEIDSVRAKGAAECIYYIQDADSAFTGVNESQSDIIDMYFRQKQLDRVVFRSAVTGTLWPIRQKSPSEMHLTNFRWQEERRPKSKFEMYEAPRAWPKAIQPGDTTILLQQDSTRAFTDPIQPGPDSTGTNRRRLEAPPVQPGIVQFADTTKLPQLDSPRAFADSTQPRLDSTLTDRLRFEASDTIPLAGDSVLQRTDTFSLRLSKDSLDGPVKYAAEDSVVVQIQSKKIILYGKTKTDYKDVSLTAPKVMIDQETQIMTAYNRKDSAGISVEDAHFIQGDQGFTSDTIHYNFKTQKGLTKNTITQTGEMFVHGELVKKVSNEVTYVKRGYFTTCNLDEPHFGFRANKLKVVNKKVAISGPTHPEFEGVPLPIYIPFGYFPLNQGRHSGMLPPTFSPNEQMGLGLEGIGYYQVFNDYWDAKFYGNIYSYGSWSFNVNPEYYKRYHYRGSMNFGLQKTKRSFKGDPDYYSSNTFSLNWSHAADVKARPGTNFSANVNASSTSYNRNVPNDPMLNFQNQLTSSITYSKTWVDKPYNLTVSANHNQNNQTRLVNVSLPDVGFTVSTIYPFQKKDFAGTKKWYEQLGVAYSGSFRNQVSFYDTAFTLRHLIDTLQWGAQHSFPITLSLPPILGGAVVVAPSVSYSQVWIAQKFRRKWNTAEQKVDTTITKGFFVDQQASFGIGFNTAVFGTFQFKHSRVIAIRHTIRPSIGFSYRPDLSKEHYYSDTINTQGYVGRFSEFEGALYPGFSEGRGGYITFSLDNNLEMKYRSKKDTGDNAIKKLRLIDGFGFSTGYNFLADSLKLTPFSLYFRTNLFEKINLSANGTLDPYEVDELGRDINKYTWAGKGFSLGRLSSASISLSTSFQSKPKDEDKDKQRKEELDKQLNDPILAADRQRLLDYMRQNPAEFVDFNIPWQISLSYSLNYSQSFRPDYSGFEKVIGSSASFNGSFSLTPKWNFSTTGFYDFKTQKIQTFSMSISREMHCWQMSINVSPIGVYRFFSFTISPKSSLLQDLKINRTRSFYTGPNY